MHPNSVKLLSLKKFQYHLEITHQVDEYTFQTKVCYPGVDLFQLSQRYDDSLLGKIYAHIALFETLKYCSLFPISIDVSLISSDLTPDAIDFFLTTFRNAYTQCQYENGIGDEYTPKFIHRKLGDERRASDALENCNAGILVGNGGGKDSILAMKLLEKSDVKYSTYQWTRSEYGRSEYQQALCSKLLMHASPSQVHKVSVFDDFTESPFMELYYPHLKGAFTLGIPECIFEALPVMLYHQYASLCFANERSSDTGNLFWEGIDREVNHQWVKSLDAERFFEDYIHRFLLSGFKYFSILKPIYDYRIFGLISEYPEVIQSTHSCNVDKPWCKKCAKCAYVWLGFFAHFDKQLVDCVFGANPFDDEDLIVHYKHMTGMEGHRSFECIGNVEECQLFMKRCVEKGMQGKMLEIFKNEIEKKEIDWAQIETKYNQVHPEHNIPETLFQKIQSNL